MIARRRDGALTVSAEEVQQYEMLRPLLASMRDTFDELAKKKPDGTLSKTKVAMVNRLLAPIYKLLENEPNHQFLDLLDEIEMPQNSDVILILNQALTAMETFYDSRAHRDGLHTDWNLKK